MKDDSETIAALIKERAGLLKAGDVLLDELHRLTEQNAVLLAALERAMSCHWLSIDYTHNRTKEACDVRHQMVEAIRTAKGDA